MKIVLRLLLTLAVEFVIYSFIIASFNPWEWSVLTRWSFPIVLVLVFFILEWLIIEVRKENEEKMLNQLEKDADKLEKTGEINQMINNTNKI